MSIRDTVFILHESSGKSRNSASAESIAPTLQARENNKTPTRFRVKHRGHYRRATLLELKGQTPLTAIPGVAIDWDQVLAEIS